MQPLCALAPLLAFAVVALHSTDARPNIILFFPDEMRHDWVNNGTATDFLRTPNLDSIRQRGVKFNRAIAASPICAPSRACMAAGSNYEEVGVLTNKFNFPTNRLTTYFKLLRDSGYHTMSVGKVDLNKKDESQGFGWGTDGSLHADEFGFSRMVNCNGVYAMGYMKNPYVEPYTHFLVQHNKSEEYLADVRSRVVERNESSVDGAYAGLDYVKTDPNPLPDELFNDNWVADNAIRLLSEAQADPAVNEWFLVVNWNGPHYPMSVTQSMWNSVQNRTFPQPVDYTGPLNASQLNSIRGDYAALIENIDRQIGRILSTVKDLDNTVIVFASDHGDMLGDRGRWKKSVPFAGAVQVPLMIAGNTVVSESQRGKTTDTGVSLIDIAATLLEIGEISSIPTQMSEAVSLRPILAGKTAPRRVVRSAYKGWRLWFDGRFKYITGFSDESTLYDLDSDPFERNNLLEATDPVLLAHYERIVQWLLGKGDAAQVDLPSSNGATTAHH